MVVTGMIKWAFINTLANTDSKKYKNCWCINVYPSDEEVDRLEKMGLKAKVDGEDGSKFFKFKRNEIKGDGTPAKAPKCVDRLNRLFEGNIGNGSKCKVQFLTFDWEGDTLAYLQGVQVLDLVSYGAADGEEFKVEDEDVAELTSEENPF